MSKLIELFWTFMKPGIFGFGGGQAMIPLIQEEVVENKGWLTDGEFADYLAMGNSLPGPITTKMSLIIGYNMGGPLGAITALIGLILPSAIAILVLFNFFLEYKDTAFVKGMQKAAKPVVVALIAGVALSMARGSVFTGIDFASSTTWIVMALFVVASAIVLLNEFAPWFDLHPAIVIVTALLIGGFFIR